MRRSLGREAYVRPPLVAVEPRSDRAGTWRFRAAFTLLLVAILVGVYFLYRALTGSTGEGSPGFQQGLPAPASIGSAAGR